MNILVIGKSPETLEKILAGLRAKGIAALGTTEMENASVDFNAKDLALVAFGGGVDLLVREKLKREFTSHFEITEHEGSYIVRLDVMKECDVHVEVYHLRDTLHAETIVEQHVSSGPFEARIDERKIANGLTMILVTLGESEFYIHRIDRT